MPTVTVTAAGETSTVTYGGRALAFFDDFTAGLGKWNVRTDWQNNHYGYNTPANVTVQPDGLHITARRQTGLPGQPSTKPYTTGYIDTIGRFSQFTGRWQIVARMPRARGLWPALWLRCDTTLAEIDMLEAVDPLNDAVETVHQSTNGDLDKSGFEYKPAGLDLTAWHTYGLERDPDGTLRWDIDGTLTHTRKPTDISTKLKQPMTWLSGPTFASPLNLRINLQVGGSMPASFGMDVDSTTVLPDEMVIRSVTAWH